MGHYIKKIKLCKYCSYTIDCIKDITKKMLGLLLIPWADHKTKRKKGGIAICHRAHRTVMEKEISFPDFLVYMLIFRRAIDNFPSTSDIVIIISSHYRCFKAKDRITFFCVSASFIKFHCTTYSHNE